MARQADWSCSGPYDLPSSEIQAKVMCCRLTTSQAVYSITRIPSSNDTGRSSFLQTSRPLLYSLLRHAEGYVWPILSRDQHGGAKETSLMKFRVLMPHLTSRMSFSAHGQDRNFLHRHNKVNSVSKLRKLLSSQSLTGKNLLSLQQTLPLTWIS